MLLLDLALILSHSFWRLKISLRTSTAKIMAIEDYENVDKSVLMPFIWVTNRLGIFSWVLKLKLRTFSFVKGICSSVSCSLVLVVNDRQDDAVVPSFYSALLHLNSTRFLHYIMATCTSKTTFKELDFDPEYSPCGLQLIMILREF